MSKKSNKVFMIFSALCILFVVDAHAGSPLGILKNLFPYNSFFMPAFCFISGYFFKHEKLNSYGAFIFYKMKKLWIPFVIWNIIYGLFVNVLKHFEIIYYGERVSLETIFIRPFLDCTMFQFNNPAWFVPALFSVIVVYSFFRKCLSSCWNEYVMSLVFILFGTICVFFSRKGYYANPNILFILKTGFLMQFYQLGYLFKTHMERVYHRIPTALALIIPILINIICIYISENKIYFNNLASMSGFLTDYYILPFLTSISGILFWIKISELLVPALANNKVVNFVSDNTWAIMMHHIFFFNIYNVILAVLSKLINQIPFNIKTFRSTAWYIFDPMPACAVVYVFFGMAGPLYIKYVIGNLRKMKRHKEACQSCHEGGGRD